jgi:hypothetical protein
MVGLTLLGSGQPENDFVQDLAGARALRHGGNAYPLVSVAAAELGLVWEIEHQSTHPPSAFLFALPLADLPWPQAASLWTLAMLATLLATSWALRVPWQATALAPLFLLWPPVTYALFQTSPIWLIGLALAWRWRNSPYVAGVCLGIASLPKFFAAFGLLVFIRQREWRALVGFVAVWVLAVGLILVLNAGAVPQYIMANRSESPLQIARLDNGALLPAAWAIGGHVAIILAAGLVGCAAALLLRSREMTASRWALCVWLGVALLPIAWTYSLLPLLPWLIRLLWRGEAWPRLLSALAIGSSFFGFFPTANSWAIALTIASAGGAFMLDTVWSRRSAPVRFALSSAARSGMRAEATATTT